jgi:rubredoxin
MERYTCPVCGYDGLPEPPIDSFGYQTYITCSMCSFVWDDRYTNEELDHFIYKWARKEWRKKQTTAHHPRAKLA